jgi:hypothetical protein
MAQRATEELSKASSELELRWRVEEARVRERQRRLAGLGLSVGLVAALLGLSSVVAIVVLSGTSGIRLAALVSVPIISSFLSAALGLYFSERSLILTGRLSKWLVRNAELATAHGSAKGDRDGD